MQFKVNLIEKRTAQILLGLLIISLWFQSWPVILGLLSGGLVGLFNLRWLWWMIHKIVMENRKLYAFHLLGKFLFLGAIIFLIFRILPINHMAFLVGISSFIPSVISIGWQNVLAAKRGQRI